MVRASKTLRQKVVNPPGTGGDQEEAGQPLTETVGEDIHELSRELIG